MKKRLEYLLKEIPDLRYGPDFSQAEISSIEYDSRRCGPGTLFTAIEGFKSDGHSFVSSAVAAGASAVAVSRERFAEFAALEAEGVAVLSVGNTRSFLSAVSASFYGYPSKKMTIVGITGTNGKTSITYMLESIMKEGGYSPGVIGTINYRWADKTVPAMTTTPESLDLQRLLSEMLTDRVDCAIMEVSSHALSLSRVDHIDFDCAVFTNLTGDHLDFHHDMRSYLEAKKRLFQILAGGRKDKRYAVINMDDPAGREIYSECLNLPVKAAGFGIENKSEFSPDPDSIENRIDGVFYRLETPESIEISLPLAGRFHVYNSLASIAAARLIGVDFGAIRAGLSKLPGVPGRFETIVSENGFSAVVDYAHTPDALLKLLQSVREVAHGRVITVFGCGGDRDKTKRPVMGEIADSHSDIVIVTSDNPRSEDPELIIRDILKGVKNSRCRVSVDRDAAIRMAVMSAFRDDTIVVAGKGHEDYQILGEDRVHFDDRETVIKYINERKKNEG